MSNLMPVEEGARYVNLSPDTIRKWIWQGRIAYVKLGRRVLLRQEDLDELVLSCLVKPRQGNEKEA